MDRLANFVMTSFILFLFFSTHNIGSMGQMLTEDFMVNKTNYNDLYDCVDFYKQPAFEHPLLINHTFHYEMIPYSPKMMRSSTKLLANDTEFHLKGKNCPLGTVPIRRISDEDRIREKLHVEIYESKSSANNIGYTELAITRTKQDQIRQYNGGSAIISIWNPRVKDSQYSSGQIVVRNGQDNIQVGWTVTPTLYGDHRTHLFIYTSVGAMRCFNTYCPAFVIVDKNFIVDEILNESKRGGPIYDIPLMIYKDKRDGHWWLAVGTNFKPVGFWPKNIFTADMATSVEWGGQAYSPRKVPSPPMGSGAFVKENFKYDAYCKFTKIINMNQQIVDAEITRYYLTSRAYEVKGYKLKGYGLVYLWGGPGGAI